MRNTVFYTVLDNLEIFFRCGLEAANREFGDTTDAYRLIDGAFFIDDFIPLSFCVRVCVVPVTGLCPSSSVSFIGRWIDWVDLIWRMIRRHWSPTEPTWNIHLQWSDPVNRQRQDGIFAAISTQIHHYICASDDSFELRSSLRFYHFLWIVQPLIYDPKFTHHDGQNHERKLNEIVKYSRTSIPECFIHQPFTQKRMISSHPFEYINKKLIKNLNT